MIAAVPALAWLSGSLGPRAQAAVAVIALVATIDALRVGTTTRPAVVYAGFAVAALIVAAVAAVAATRGRRDLRIPRAGVALAAGAGLLAVLVVAGERMQSSYNESRYRDRDPVIDRVIDRGDDEAEIALAGAWSLDGIVPTYPVLRTPARPTTSPTSGRSRMTRCSAPTRSRRSPPTALAEADPDLLLLGRNDTLLYPQTPTPATAAELEGWAGDAGYRPIAESERFLLLERRAAPSAAGEEN